MLIPIPFAADRELRRFPIVTLFLVGLNCAVFLLSVSDGPVTLGYIVQTYGLRGVHPELPTLFTSVILHAGILHLLTNVLYLWLFGCLVEDALGRVEYLLFYIGSGIAGGLLRIVVAQHLLPVSADQAAVGASGAVAGILGIFAIRFYRARIKTLFLVPIQIPALPAIGLWIGSQMAFAVWSLVSETGTGCWSHLGGFAFGLICGLVMHLGSEAEDEYVLRDAERDIVENNVKRALEVLHQREGRDPEDTEVHRLLAAGYRRLGRLDVAEMHARQSVEIALARKDIIGAMVNYLELKDILGVLSLDARYSIACILESQHRLSEAAAAYRRVYQDFPEVPLAGTALMRCVELLRRRRGGASEAAKLAREYLGRYPEGEWRAQAQRYVKE